MLANFRDAARAELERLFVETLPTIRRILAGLSRRQGMLMHDAEDFSSLVKTKLIENDYAVIRKFRGESHGDTVPWCPYMSMTRRPGSRYGRGRSSTPYATVKTAVVAPMPIASVRMATLLNAGWRFSVRHAYLKS